MARQERPGKLLDRGRRDALPVLAAAALLGAALPATAHPPPAAAPADVPISEQEFQSALVNKTLLLRGADGKDYGLRLEEGGRAVVSLTFNDVGRWRSTGPGAYCVRWNKAALDERCGYVMRLEGKLAIRQSNGTVASIEKVQ